MGKLAGLSVVRPLNRLQKGNSIRDPRGETLDLLEVSPHGTWPNLWELRDLWQIAGHVGTAKYERLLDHLHLKIIPEWFRKLDTTVGLLVSFD